MFVKLTLCVKGKFCSNYRMFKIPRTFEMIPNTANMI